MERALTPTGFERLLATDVRVGVAYALAAAVFVIAGALVAPTHRRSTAIVLYALGAYVAWTVLDGWYFPEFHPRAYEQSMTPLGLTLAGGVIGVLVVIARDRARYFMRNK